MGTFDLLLIDHFGDEVVVMLLLEVVQRLVRCRFLLQLFYSHLMVV